MLNSAIAKLRAFPYLSNYLQLAAIEREALAISHKSCVTFIGGGPMPLTVIALALMEIAEHQGILAQFKSSFSPESLKASDDELEYWLSQLLPEKFQGEFRLDSFDVMPDAVIGAEKLIEFLGLSHIISSRLGDGSELVLSKGTNAVMIASMAEPKELILRNIAQQGYNQEGLSILVRSVEEHNLRRLLYEPVDEKMVTRILKEFPNAVCSERFTPPAGSDLINSFLILSIPSKNTMRDLSEHL